jgi:hypothetical protein
VIRHSLAVLSAPVEVAEYVTRFVALTRRGVSLSINSRQFQYRFSFAESGDLAGGTVDAASELSSLTARVVIRATAERGEPEQATRTRGDRVEQTKRRGGELESET